MPVEVIVWPESQVCVGCVHGSLILDEDKYGSSAYICELEMVPDGNGDEGCSQCILVDLEEDKAKGEGNED